MLSRAKPPTQAIALKTAGKNPKPHAHISLREWIIAPKLLTKLRRNVKNL